MLGNDARRGVKIERVVVAVFIALLSVQLARAVHDGWFQYLGTNAARQQHFLRTADRAVDPAYAPETYRVAMPSVARWLIVDLHLGTIPSVLAGFDLVFCFGALWFLYSLVVDRLRVEDPRRRWLGIAAFFAMVQFGLAFVVPWQRPETMATAFYVALTLFLLERGGVAAWGVLPLAAWQGLVRSDVPVVVGVAVLLASVLVNCAPDRALRPRRVLLGVGILVAAGGVQAWLQFVKYPHLGYAPDSQMVQIAANLTRHNAGSLMVALLPFLLAVGWMLSRKQALGWVDRVVLTGAGIYLPLWLTVGLAAEVRIYVPFLLGLSMVTARVFEREGPGLKPV